MVRQSQLSKYVMPFSNNWNNKLNCHFFTTLRLYNHNHHYVGNVFSVGSRSSSDVHKPILFNVSIRSLTIFYLKDLNDSVAYIDAGMDKICFTAVIKKMYTHYDIDWNTRKLVLLVLENINYL